MGNIVIFAEKPDIGTRLAATLGGCFIQGKELKPEMLTDKKYEPIIKKERHTKGYLNASYKNQDYIITWGFGHVAELYQAKDYDKKYQSWREDYFPFIPEEYRLKLKEATSKHFDLVKGFFNDKHTDSIINATDSDREGELIFYYAYHLSGSKKSYKRLWINSYTEEAIFAGFDKLKEEKDVLSLQHAGRGRAIADWLVGANLTAMGTIKFGGYNDMVSIGRVQTPTLALLVNRELEVLNFKPEPYFELVGTFAAPTDEKYTGKWKRGKTDRFTKKEKAKEILAKVDGKNGKIIKYEKTETSEKPPLLYDLTSLQMDCNAKHAFSAKETLDIAQKLYENQLITYPRTNSRFLSESLKGEIPRILKALPDKYSAFRDKLKKLSFPKRIFDDAKVESHYAIIPTYKTPSHLSSKEMDVYDLIAKSLLKAFMPDALWGNVKIETEVEKEIFFSSGKTLLDAGWRIVDGKSEEKEELLPSVLMDMQVKGIKYEILEKKTKPPNRFTEKTLLSAMETAGKLVEDDELREAMKDHGMGTPATRASIIERLLSVGYARREKKNLLPTEKGIKIIQTFPIKEIKSPSMTGEWEFKLGQIEKGKLEFGQFCSEIEAFTADAVTRLKTEQGFSPAKKEDFFGICPKCSGIILKSPKGWSCNNWRSGCKFTIWDNTICGKKLSDANVKQILTKGETSQIKGFESRAGKAFDAKLALDKENTGKIVFKF